MSTPKEAGIFSLPEHKPPKLSGVQPYRMLYWMINEMLLREFATPLLIFLSLSSMFSVLVFFPFFQFGKIIQSCYKSPNLIPKQEANEEQQQMITLQQKRRIPATNSRTFILPSVTLPSNYGAAECAGGVRDPRCKKEKKPPKNKLVRSSDEQIRGS